MKAKVRMGIALTIGCGLALAAVPDGTAEPAHSHGEQKQASGRQPLPATPEKLPGWMKSRQHDKIFYRRGPYNFDIYNIPALAYDLNAVAVGHAMAYEDLVTGKARDLESKTFNRINWVLNHPPKLMPDEGALLPTFGRRYVELEKVFDWTHLLHAQTVDVLASTDLTLAQKDQEIERLWRMYSGRPYAITPLPMNMEYLYGQPYSKAFRDRFPKVNGLFWGYHWLQGAMYDLLYGLTLPQQRASYEVYGERYHQVELYRTDRYFMPMFAEVSPVFAAKFPHIANAFDNLHMLHDMVNDILATDGMSEKERKAQIDRAIWMVLASTHDGEKPGDFSADRLHDHRFFLGMSGMGIMPGATDDPIPDLMYMQDLGWMVMADCHHCNMPLPEGEDAWRITTTTADGWTMRARCALCARDMAAEAKGRAVLRIPTEEPGRILVLISDEMGNWHTDMPGAVFLEAKTGHPTCDGWSRVFTSRAAFDAYVKASPEYVDAKPLSLAEWGERYEGTPETYVKPEGPVENPYAKPAPEEEPATISSVSGNRR